MAIALDFGLALLAATTPLLVVLWTRRRKP